MSSTNRWRLWALLPIVLLVGVVSLFVASGDSLTGLIRDNPPSADTFDIRRVSFEPGEIKIRVTNPQPEDLTIAVVTVDDAIVPFTLDGPQTLGRLRSSTIVVPFEWVEDEPISVGVTSSTGIQTTEEIAAAVETPAVAGRSVLGYALIGFLVGVVPIAFGLLWLPSLRRAAPQWLAAFMALTAGLLTFLAIEALDEALELQEALPGATRRAGARPARRRGQLPDARAHLRSASARSRPSAARRSAAWRSRRWSRSVSAYTTSARGSRSARRSRSASSRSGRSSSSASWSTTSPRDSRSPRLPRRTAATPASPGSPC